jgi:hypothetical protein
VHQDGRILGRFQMAMGWCFLLPGRLAGSCTVIEDSFYSDGNDSSKKFFSSRISYGST